VLPPPHVPIQEVPELSTREVLIIHHTDCGAMAAMRHHNHLVERMQELLSQWNVLGWLLQVRGLGWGGGGGEGPAGDMCARAQQ
jgi:hypothetical protein